MSKITKGKFTGWVGFFSDRNIRGWLRDSEVSDAKCKVRVTVGDYSGNLLTANEHRPHLVSKGVGDGNFGFTLSLPAKLRLTGEEMVRIFSEPHGVEVFSRRLKGLEGGGAKSLVTSELTQQATEECGISEVTCSIEPKTACNFLGWVGAFTARRISGWIANKTWPDQPQRIIVQVGRYKSQPIIADESREHLSAKELSSTKLGFSYILPDDVPVSADDKIRILHHDGTFTGISTAIGKEYGRFIDVREIPKKPAKFPRNKQEDAVILWCPISVSGLTTQLEQITSILKYLKIKYYISYHIAPSVKHPEVDNWIEPKDIDSPKAVFYFERFVAFDRGFEGAFKIFYVNLDWLSDSFIGLARVNADIVLAPVTYRHDYLEECFPNQKVYYLPWPSAIEPDVAEQKNTVADRDQKINVLYVGNDYNKASRKSPFAAIDAITSYQGNDLVFDLKFRTALPNDVRARLEACSCVRTIIDYSITKEEVAALHKIADVSLIPNECEGNGLSILEAWAFDVVPAVLDGHPMCDVASDDCAFFIQCEQYGWREKTPVYRTTATDVSNFFEQLSWETIAQRREGVKNKRRELQARKIALHEVVRNLMHMAGLRNRSVRIQVESAHLMDQSTGEPQAQKLIFGSNAYSSKLMRPVQTVDVIMTTSQRPQHLSRSLPALVDAIEKSPYRHRFFMAVDGLDNETSALLDHYRAALDVVMYTRTRSGLPYTWNSIRHLNDIYAIRSEQSADYLCYIQDDCLINDPSEYFRTMVEVASGASPSILGLVSGFHTDVHPGFAKGKYQGNQIIYSDTIDGKNFMAPPRIFRSIAPLTWWFSDGMRRGNPGPVRGSHFDLWLWKESPNALAVQKRINIVIPKLTSHIASDATESTWNNDTTDANTQNRIDEGKIYRTRTPAKS